MPERLYSHEKLIVIITRDSGQFNTPLFMLYVNKTRFSVFHDVRIRRALIGENLMKFNFRLDARIIKHYLWQIDDQGEIDGETMLSMVMDDMKSPLEQALKTCLPNIGNL